MKKEEEEWPKFKEDEWECEQCKEINVMTYSVCKSNK